MGEKILGFRCCKGASKSRVCISGDDDDASHMLGKSAYGSSDLVDGGVSPDVQVDYRVWYVQFVEEYLG